MPQHPLRGRTPGRRRIASTVAGSAAFIAILAPTADAAFTSTACGGANIAGTGASFQAGAQQGFIANFKTADFCPGPAPTVTYSATGSGAGRSAMGDNATGARLTTNNTRYGGTDEAPTPSQTLAMEQGPKTGAGDLTDADDGELHVIPVAVGANAIVMNFPDGCTPPVGSLANPPTPDAMAPTAGSSKRVKLTAQVLEAAFYGDPDVNTWGEILPGITGTPTDAVVVAGPDATAATGDDITTCAAVPVRRVVRFDNSGTTFVQKDWLQKTKGDRSPAWSSASFQGSGNTAWPNGVPSNTGVTTSPCPITANLCKNTSNGNGPLLDRLNTTDGAIGYSDVSTARSKGFEVGSSTSERANDTTFWAPIVHNNGTAYEPTSDPTAWQTNVGLRGSNCASAVFVDAPATTLGNWQPTSGTVGPAGAFYPLCTFTYMMAWDDYAPPYGLSAANEQAARTVKDYLDSIVDPLGQSALAPRDYSPLPIAIRQIARAGVDAIGYDKAGDAAAAPPPAPPAPAAPAPLAAAPIAPIGGTTPPPAPTVPSNQFSISSARASGTNLVLSLQLPGAGTVVARATARIGRRTVTVGTVRTTRTTSGAARLIIRASKTVKNRLKRFAVRTRVRVTYTPRGGTARTITRTVTLKKAKAKKKAKRKASRG